MKMQATQLVLLLALGSPLSGEIIGSVPNSNPTPHKDPYTPIGSISVTPTVVQPGVRPKMVWEIESVSYTHLRAHETLR